MKNSFFIKLALVVSVSQCALVAKILTTQQMNLAIPQLPTKSACTEIPFSITSSIKYNTDDLQKAIVESFSSSAHEMWGKIENRVYVIGAVIFAYMIYQVWDSCKKRKLLKENNKLLAASMVAIKKNTAVFEECDLLRGGKKSLLRKTRSMSSLSILNS